MGCDIGTALTSIEQDLQLQPDTLQKDSFDISQINVLTLSQFSSDFQLDSLKSQNISLQQQQQQFTKQQLQNVEQMNKSIKDTYENVINNTQQSSCLNNSNLNYPAPIHQQSKTLNYKISNKQLSDDIYFETYLAINTTFNKILRCKKINLKETNQFLIDLFCNDILISANLNSQYTTKIFDYKFSDQNEILSFHQYNWINLQQIMKEYKYLPQNFTLFVLKDILSALKYLHEIKITFNAIDIQNIVFGDKNAILTNFYFATQKPSQLQQTGNIFFLLPMHFIQKCKINEFSMLQINCFQDIYMLGQIVIYMISGKPWLYKFQNQCDLYDFIYNCDVNERNLENDIQKNEKSVLSEKQRDVYQNDRYQDYMLNDNEQQNNQDVNNVKSCQNQLEYQLTSFINTLNIKYDFKQFLIKMMTDIHVTADELLNDKIFKDVGDFDNIQNWKQQIFDYQNEINYQNGIKSQFTNSDNNEDEFNIVDEQESPKTNKLSSEQQDEESISMRQIQIQDTNYKQQKKQYLQKRTYKIYDFTSQIYTQLQQLNKLANDCYDNTDCQVKQNLIEFIKNTNNLRIPNYLLIKVMKLNVIEICRYIQPKQLMSIIINSDIVQYSIENHNQIVINFLCDFIMKAKIQNDWRFKQYYQKLKPYYCCKQINKLGQYSIISQLLIQFDIIITLLLAIKSQKYIIFIMDSLFIIYTILTCVYILKQTQYARYSDVIFQQLNLQNYCYQCQMYIQQHTHHCNYCGKCIQAIDHHCHVLGRCISKQCYLHFFTFLLTSDIVLLTNIISGIYDINSIILSINVFVWLWIDILLALQGRKLHWIKI